MNKTHSKIFCALAFIAAVIVTIALIVACLILIRVGAEAELSMPSMQEEIKDCFSSTNTIEEITWNELN